MSLLPRIPNQADFVRQEKATLQFWKERDIFKKSLNSRAEQEHYVFYDGPPFATGLPHYGHLLASIIKDIVPRYYAMQGKYVERRFGWDCHGLPVEMEMQKTLDLKTSQDIEEYGIREFNAACKGIVLRYTGKWQETIERIGRWVDFENDFKTMDRDFMESIWWVFHELHKKGLIYKGFKVVPYSWKATTILSNFEAKLNYQNVQDPSVIVSFPLREGFTIAGAKLSGAHKGHKVNLLAWTTTPWTLIANLALAVHPKTTYVEVVQEENGKSHHYILAESLVGTVFAKQETHVLRSFLGAALVGLRYEPLFPFAGRALTEDPKLKNAFQVFGDDFVSDDNGTGIVHMAPAYGEEDFRIGKAQGLPHYDPIDRDGFFTEEIAFIAKKNFKDADKIIIKALKQRGHLFSQATLVHSYPFCWRTDTPLMYKAISTWFVNVEAIKDDLIANNETIHWIPEHIKHGRFGEWLQDAKDWAISRNRYWGTPIPIWEAPDGEQLCFGDIASLAKASGQKIGDLHRPGIDDIKIERDGKIFTRVPEVLDCWFESGSMPYAYKHYPFANKEAFEASFPADFIAEGLDQTRGWFYTLLVISTCLFNKSSFKNVIVNGLILAQDGKKMSKRLKNYPDPKEIIDAYGADALRGYLISSQVLKGETMSFSRDAILVVMRNIMIPLWNSLSFLSTYANMDGWEPPQDRSWLYLDPQYLTDPLDRWIIATRESLLASVHTAMHEYKLYKATEPLAAFVDKLTNIYIRRSRERFWKRESDEDKKSAYRTLYSVLKYFSIVLAPFMPFLAEELYQTLRNKSDKESVHLEDYPKAYEAAHDQVLEEELATVNTIIALGRQARLKAGFPIRQPIASLTVLSSDPKLAELLTTYAKMIKHELNVKTIAHHDQESDFITYRAKANFKVLGKRLGKQVKAVNTALMQLSSKELALALATQEFGITITGVTGSPQKIALKKEEVIIHREKKGSTDLHTSGPISCFIERNITPELSEKGIIRDLIRDIQQQRKEKSLEYDAMIWLTLTGDEEILNIVKRHQKMFMEQTLCKKLDISPSSTHLKKQDEAGSTEKNALVHLKVHVTADKVLKTFTRAIALDPKLAPAYSNRGIAYSSLKQYDKAIADFNKAIALDPKLAMAYNNRGAAYGKLKQYDKAIADFTEAIKIEPQFALAYSNRGIAYASDQQYKKAIADCTEAIALDPKLAPAYSNRGIAYSGLKQYDKAIADFDKAIALDPQLALAYNNRGNAYNELKQYDKAIEDFTKAIALDPQYALAYNNRGAAYSSLKQYDKAIADFNKASADHSKARELDPDHPLLEITPKS